MREQKLIDEAAAEDSTPIVVTGSRIARPQLESQTPVTVDALPPEAWPSAGFSKHSGLQEVIGMSLRVARERFEREYLNVQITRFGGNISRTAAFIGMERSALHRKLKSLGVDAPGRGPADIE